MLLRVLFLLLTFCFAVFFYLLVITPNYYYKQETSSNQAGLTGSANSKNAVVSVPITKREQMDNLSVYRNDKIKAELCYPSNWHYEEAFDVDEYQNRTYWIKNPVRFNHDIYSKVSFWPTSERTFVGINSLSVTLYPNSKNLSLYEYFKGKSEPLEGKDFPNDVFISELIKQGKEIVFGKYQGIQVRDMSYSDVGYQLYRKIYIPMEGRIYEISFGYARGEGFGALQETPLTEDFANPAPSLLDEFVERVGSSFVIL